MNVALYIRVSTEYQLELSPDSQKRLLLEYAAKHDYIVNPEHVFIDEGISGRKAEKRPEFMKMITLAKSKTKYFEKILVWKFSRFARNQEESIVYKNMLKKDGIEVISISEPIIDSPFGSLIERIIEWTDEYYSIRLSSEVTRGMKEKALRGGVQSSPTLGYDIIDNKRVLNPEESEIVKRAFNMLLNGSTTGEIARCFNGLGLRNKRGNLFEGRSIKYMLQNPVYYGYNRWNYATQKEGRKVNPEEEWIIVKGEHEPIISADTWNKAQAILSTHTRNTKPSSTGYKHWLGGLLRCANCGGTLVFKTTTSKKPYGTYTYNAFHCNKFIKGSCAKGAYITVNKIEKEILTILAETIEMINNKGTPVLDIKIKNIDDTSLLKAQLDKLYKKLDKAKAAYLNEIDTIEEYKENKNMIQKEIDSINEKIASANTVSYDPEEMKEKIQTGIDAIQDESIDIETKNKILKRFIDSIIIDKVNDTIQLKLYK